MEPSQQPSPIQAIFADSWALYSEAFEILELGRRSVAAEAAWGATKRATDALILARTGREPTATGQTSGRMRVMAHEDPAIAELRERYIEAVRDLHAKCFYLGDSVPEVAISQLIRQTAQYIQDATVLAQS